MTNPIEDEDLFPDDGLLTKSDHRLIKTGLPKITGWLAEDTAYFTAYILNYQLSIGVNGPILEFGVYHGKYMALLVHSEKKRKGWVGGYDIFQQCHPETALRHFGDIFGDNNNVAVWTADSRNLTADDVMKNIGFPPRFVSVDGDHSAQGTLHDLDLAAATGLDHVIIAADDFINPTTLGVSEGVYRFLLQENCDFVPFSYVHNKLFLCKKCNHRLYFEAATAIVDAFPFLDLSKQFSDSRKADPYGVFQPVMGHEVALFL